MRPNAVVPLVLIALATCATAPRKPGPKGVDLTIGVVLALENDKCVVRFEKPELKMKENAVAWTAHAVTWQVKSNACGEKKTEKVNGKALGLKHLRRKGATELAAWFDRCSKLDLIPATLDSVRAFKCDIPSDKEGGWNWVDDLEIYEYEIDGDSIEPLDPDIGIRRDG